MSPLQYVYVRGKLSEAVHALVISQGDVRSRVVLAFTPLIAVKTTDFPPEFQKDWEWIVTQSTKYGPQIDSDGKIWRGAVENTMKRVKCSTASKVAERIWVLYCDMDEVVRSNDK